MISYPRTLVCYCRFDTVFIFIVNSYKYQKVSKRTPANIVSWLGKTILMPNYWPSRSVLRWMSVVRNREIRNMVLLSTFDLMLTCFLFWFLYKWLKKSHTLFINWMPKWVKSIVFAVSIKFCGESGLAISSFNLVLTSSRVREIIKLFFIYGIVIILQMLSMNYYLIN